MSKVTCVTAMGPMNLGSPNFPSSEDNSVINLNQEWARDRLRHTQSVDGNVVATWCRFLQKQESQVSTLDWMAFQILNGDESAWNAGTLNVRRDLLTFQWSQLHQFEAGFFELSELDKRRSFAALKDFLINNPPALVRLSRYEAFLELGSSVAEASKNDVMQLVVRLARIAVCNPVRRSEVLVSTLNEIENEPVRWKRAATELLNNSRFAKIEPHLVQHIASIADYGDLYRERQRTRRLKFSLRYGLPLALHRLKLLLPFLLPALFIISGLFLALLFAERTSRRSAPIRTPRELQAEELLADVKSELEKFANTGGVRIQVIQGQWRDTAVLEGKAGLDKIREELQKKLDQATKAGSQDEIEMQGLSIRYFELWRHLIGDDTVLRVYGPEKEPNGSPHGWSRERAGRN